MEVQKGGQLSMFNNTLHSTLKRVQSVVGSNLNVSNQSVFVVFQAFFQYTSIHWMLVTFTDWCLCLFYMNIQNIFLLN